MIPSTSFHMIDTIRKKRDGKPLTSDEMRSFVNDYTNNIIPDYQASALLMAMFIRGLSEQELLVLTRAMLDSGQVIDLSLLPGPKVGKHSTGGVGDKVSICLAPAVAACGIYVPKLSGRGLGHTGGTLDKLESIPGFQIKLSIPEFVDILQKVGVSLIGQTEALVPADKKLYALRDVTGTVESIPLIAASIMSKKLAEGLDGLVLDVKVGSGALMKTLADSRELANRLISLGKGAGIRISAFLTNMDQPLGRFVGNAAEINESVDVLRGKGEQDLQDITCTLGGEMLRIAGKVSTSSEGEALVKEALQSGKALQTFAEMATLQGATIRLDNPAESWFHHNLHKSSTAILASRSGYVHHINAEAIGLAGVSLGIGRLKKKDPVDSAAFIYLDKKCGEFVNQGEPLCHFAADPHLSESRLQDAKHRLSAAYDIQDHVPVLSPLIFEVIS